MERFLASIMNTWMTLFPNRVKISVVSYFFWKCAQVWIMLLHQISHLNLIPEHVFAVVSNCTDLAVPLLHYLPHFPFWEAQQEFNQLLCFAFTLTDKNHNESGDFRGWRKCRKWLSLFIVQAKDDWDFTQTRKISLDLNFKGWFCVFVLVWTACCASLNYFNLIK